MKIDTSIDALKLLRQVCADALAYNLSLASETDDEDVISYQFYRGKAGFATQALQIVDMMLGGS